MTQLNEVERVNRAKVLTLFTILFREMIRNPLFTSSSYGYKRVSCDDLVIEDEFKIKVNTLRLLIGFIKSVSCSERDSNVRILFYIYC